MSQQEQPKSAPRDVFTARPGKEGATAWFPIGVAFPAKDGESLIISLHAMPIADKDGRVFLKVAPEAAR